MFKHLLLLVLTTLPAWAALAGGVFVATDTSATNARPSAVTITPPVGGTNISAGSIVLTNTTASRALVTDSTQKVTNSITTAAELAFVSGVTSAIQTQLDSKSTFTGTSGTVVNTGTPVANIIPVYSDTTGTNITKPTSAVILGDGSSATLTETINLSGTDPSWAYFSGTAALAGRITITPATADTTALTVSGGSTTGSGTTKGGTFSHTLNTSGVVDGVWTLGGIDTASGAGSKWVKVVGGAAGTTELLSVDKSGNVVAAGSLAVPNGIFSGASSSSYTVLYGSNNRLNSGSIITWSSVATEPVGGNADVGLARNSSGVLRVTDGGSGTGSEKVELQATGQVAPTIASAATKRITFISGTTTIDTITAPSPISSTGGQVTLIPTGVWATSTSGNIALVTTAVVSKALTLFYDQATAKWYPSY
jgi:hypothetical protein